MPKSILSLREDRFSRFGRWRKSRGGSRQGIAEIIAQEVANEEKRVNYPRESRGSQMREANLAMRRHIQKEELVFGAEVTNTLTGEKGVIIEITSQQTGVKLAGSRKIFNPLILKRMAG